MNLTQLQKEIISDIIDNKMYDLAMFIDKYVSHTKSKLAVNDLSKEIPEYIVTDPENEKSKFHEYASVINKLEKENLIDVIRYPRTKYAFHYYFNGIVENLPMALPMIDLLKDADIFPNIGLSKFQDNKYKTEEEIRIEKAESKTFWLQMATISIAIMSILVNLFMFSNEREVTIKNIGDAKNILIYEFTDKEIKRLQKIINDKK